MILKMQLSTLFGVAIIFSLSIGKSRAEIDAQYKASMLPHLMGAKLVGIFEDEPRPADKYSKQAQSGQNDTWQSQTARWLHQIEMRNKLHFCDEIIFEDETIRAVPSSKPLCVLGSDDVDHAMRTRRKRDIRESHLPMRFTIPSDQILTDSKNVSKPQESVLDDSYIAMEISVCSQPGGTVLIKDHFTGKTLGGFKNGGTAYHCNQWLMDRADKFRFDKSTISDSNQVFVEYQLPLYEDFTLSEVSYTFLSDVNKMGHRRIEYKSAEASDFQVFLLDIKYREIKFTFEETDGRFNNGPQLLDPIGDSPQELEPPLTYKPNWVKTYILGKRSMCEVSPDSNCHEKNFVGIQVEIIALDLDFDRGDYLLIGPGDKPEFWKNSISQMVAQKIEPEKDAGKHKIWINSDSAFVRLVTHNSLISESDNRTALQFRWTPANSTLPDSENMGPSQMIKEASIQVCFEGSECLAFKTLKDDFMAELVHIFNRYLIDNEKSITTLINKDSVQIFDMEPIYYSKGRITEQYCQFHMAISSPYDIEFPLVQSDVLTTMFFGNSNARKMINANFNFNNCIFQRISLRTILIPIGVILLLTIGIIGVFWKMHSMLVHRNKPIHKKKEQESCEQALSLSDTNNDAGMY